MSENGFCEPFVIWKDEEKKPVVIGGNQRLKALLKSSGVKLDHAREIPSSGG